MFDEDETGDEEVDIQPLDTPRNRKILIVAIVVVLVLGVIWAYSRGVFGYSASHRHSGNESWQTLFSFPDLNPRGR